jgi:hypothetical protein
MSHVKEHHQTADFTIHRARLYCLRRHTTITGHHTGVITSQKLAEYAGVMETWLYVEACSVISFTGIKFVTKAEIHHQLVEVYEACVL